jgi:hypothetical protein
MEAFDDIVRQGAEARANAFEEGRAAGRADGIREAIAICNTVLEEYRSGKLHITAWTANEVEARLRALLTAPPPPAAKCAMCGGAHAYNDCPRMVHAPKPAAKLPLQSTGDGRVHNSVPEPARKAVCSNGCGFIEGSTCAWCHGSGTPR